ncbi:MAG: lytic transglycosylase domain-containing protein, partial [Desulfosarcina sp.]
MIPKTHMTIDAYLKQAGIRPSIPGHAKNFNPLTKGVDASFVAVLDTVSSNPHPKIGPTTTGATIADYLRLRAHSAVPASLGRSTLYSGCLAGFLPHRQLGRSHPSSALKAVDPDVRGNVTEAPAGGPDCASDVDASIGRSISLAAKKYGLSEKLIESVIRAESGFRPDAVSPAGAQGLMQLMPATAKALGVNDPFDVQQNIDGGARYIRQMLDRFGGDVKLALAAYNAGPATVERYNGDVPYRETRTYVQR